MDTEIIESLRQFCEWDTSRFLIISENVFDRLVYYSHLPALIVSLILGIFILVKARKDLVSKILITIFSLFAIWVFSDQVLWATEKNELTMFFWTLEVILEPLIYAACLYFIYVFITKKDSPIWTKIVVGLLLLPIFILAPTNYALTGFDLTNCDRDATEGPLIRYGYFLEIVFILTLCIFAAWKYFKLKNVSERQQSILAVTGTTLFLISFSLGNIVGSFTDDWRIGQWGLMGMSFFAIFLTYLIVRYKAFNIGLLGAQALVIALIILLGSEFFFIENSVNQLLVAITLVLTGAIGLVLIRSVHHEIKQREEIEKLAGELKVANAHLEELSMQKSQFVSLATHQIRSPLTALKGYASLILDGDYGQISKEQKDAITAMYESAHNLITIVGDYLDISRIDLGKMKYDMTEFSLRDLVAATVHDLLPNIRTDDKKLTFAPKNPDDPCPIRADMGKIKQIVGNIIDNSIKYTPKGTITVSVEHKVATRRYLISVVDTGVGITLETKAHLFERFSRADDAHTVNTQGTGLGLFIVKQFVEAHGGRIWVESEGKDKGSQFYVELPERAEDVK